MATIAARPIKTYSPDSGDIFDTDFYDTATLASATLSYNLFQTPLSATVNKSTTNMTDAGAVPTGVQFQVQKVGLRITNRAASIAVNTGDSFADYMSALCNGLLTFNITGYQDVGQWPVAEFFGVTSFVVNSTTTLVSNIAGLNSVIPMWKTLRYPIDLNELVKWGVTLSFGTLASLPAGCVDMAVQVILSGVEQRRH